MRGATILKYRLADNSEKFQSTLPMRGATGWHSSCRSVCQNFNPRSPCGERLLKHMLQVVAVCISIHAPHAGSDLAKVTGLQCAVEFQSTLPMRGATGNSANTTSWMRFQSTLPMRGATRRRGRSCAQGSHFNPRSPCGERRGFWTVSACRPAFQSTLPMRGATLITEHRRPCPPGFQSTLPMRGATLRC